MPGLVSNCGGTDDTPTNLPLHAFTCTDADEIVAFTPELVPQHRPEPGLEVILDAQGTVTAVNHTRGTAVPAGGHTLQAIGADADKLATLAVPGNKLKVGTDLLNENGKPLKAGATTDVVNGGPALLQKGKLDVTARRDGMVRTNDSNSFFYGWAHKRNPRAFAGVDAQGRTLLVTADGRQTTSLGLSLNEEAARCPLPGNGQRHEPGRRRVHHHGRRRPGRQLPLARHRRTPASGTRSCSCPAGRTKAGSGPGGGTSRGQGLTVVWERLFPIAGRIKT